MSDPLLATSTSTRRRRAAVPSIHVEQTRTGTSTKRRVKVVEEVEPKRQDSVWLDGPLALTLLPPIGSYLTGGDFIRDSLILALLFYYLRALIKTPWELYLNARARIAASPPLEVQSEEEENAESESIRRVRAAARSELRFAELIYLSLCLATPLLGTLLLRYVSRLLSTEGTITWFSEGLFVLATGIRPWRHFISLLTTRTSDLHDIVHAPTPSAPSDATVGARIEALEDQIATLTGRFQGTTETVQKGTKDLRTLRAKVDESTDHLETQLRNALRAAEESRLETEARLEEITRILHKSASGGAGLIIDNDVTAGGGKGPRAGTLTPRPRRIPDLTATGAGTVTPDALTTFVLDHLTSRRRRAANALLPDFSFFRGASKRYSLTSAAVSFVLLPVKASQVLLNLVLSHLGVSALAPSVAGSIVEGDAGRAGITIELKSD